MSQHAYARALALLADNGVDHDTARYIMKRLHDYGYTVTTRHTDPPDTHPPATGGTRAARKATRASLAAQMRADVARAREEYARAAEAAENAARDAQTVEVERQRRALAVQKVLAGLP